MICMFPFHFCAQLGTYIAMYSKTYLGKVYFGIYLMFLYQNTLLYIFLLLYEKRSHDHIISMVSQDI